MVMDQGRTVGPRTMVNLHILQSHQPRHVSGDQRILQTITALAWELFNVKPMAWMRLRHICISNAAFLQSHWLKCRPDGTVIPSLEGRQVSMAPAIVYSYLNGTPDSKLRCCLNGIMEPSGLHFSQSCMDCLKCSPDGTVMPSTNYVTTSTCHD